jgi:5'-nucleotidase
MSEPVVERVLLTNDDGIDAPGLAVLAEVAATIAREVWIVAPEHDQSGTSHSISLHDPLRITEHGPRRFGISGTPGDCVVMAVRHVMRDTPRTWCCPASIVVAISVSKPCSLAPSAQP